LGGFYGLGIDAEGFFFVVDRSLFMAGNGEFTIIKREIMKAIQDAGAGSQFGIVFFDSVPHQYPPAGKPFSSSDADAVREAFDFIQNIGGSNFYEACPGDGLLAAFAFGEASTAKKSVVIYAGGGAGLCGESDEATYLNQTLQDVTVKNSSRFPIYTVGELVRSPIRDQFLGDLARENGGTYTPFVR
jgi:hypothetical protein